MKRRISRGVVRRAFLGGALAGGLSVVAGRALRRPTGEGGGRLTGAAGRRGARVAEPWAPLREEVITPDELEPSGRELAG